MKVTLDLVRHHFVMLLTSALILLVVTFFTAYLVGQYQSEQRRQALFADRDFSLTPFAMNDAVDACGFEAREKHGDSLLRAIHDSHSSRFDLIRQIYLVVMRGDVGETNHFDEMMIYCYVDPRQHVVTYYKSSFLDPEAFFNNTRSFFK